MGRINFNTEDIRFNLKEKLKVKSWLNQIIQSHGFKLSELNFIFCSDDYLLQINKEYLDHDTYTDIITFDNSEEEKMIEGDIFISVDRIKENADKFQVSFDDEIHRVLAHGTLHLLGFKDKSPKDKKIMTEQENVSLQLWKNIN